MATRNPDKLREIRSILDDPDLPGLLDLTAVGIPESDEEDDLERFESFEENALAKAHYFASLSGLVTLADDSGLCVDALQGAPGVRSKRFSGRTDLTGPELDLANNLYLIHRMHGVPDSTRTASYVCAIAIASPSGAEATVRGSCAGQILNEPRGDGGFGYDPYFLIPDRRMTVAELPPATKNMISHRARALHELRETISRRLDLFGSGL